MNLNQYSQSAAQPGLAVDSIANLEIPVPPVSEQRSIADYLNRKTAEVDALAQAKERLLVLLTEKRRALIAHAVGDARHRGAGPVLIGADPDWFFGHRPGRRSVFAPEAEEDYLRCYRNPDTIHAACEDYRAAATYDFALDEADRGRKKIAAPLLVLWSARGLLPAYDVLAIWRDWADDVRGSAVESGHFMAEEAPEATYAALRSFFAR